MDHENIRDGSLLIGKATKRFYVVIRACVKTAKDAQPHVGFYMDVLNIDESRIYKVWSEMMEIYVK